MSTVPDVSIVIVSFNTRDLLRECLLSLEKESTGVHAEIFVVDNNSRDRSAEMVEAEFPQIKLIRSKVNLGFAAANNAAFPSCSGRYILLLNSDAFLNPQALQRSIAYMDADPGIGLGGARLVGRDDSWQPSARLFPSPLNDFLTISGLSGKYPHSRFFGRFDRSWADINLPADVDWVPGAFSIVRRQLLEEVGYFDENFFLYYEEVDLCRRVKAKGFFVRYWPDVVVVHLGGESSKTVTNVAFSKSGSQLALWRMRAAMLYYRKHHGPMVALLAMRLELYWHLLRVLSNRRNSDPIRTAKAEAASNLAGLVRQAWKETQGGKLCPPRPW